MSQNLKSIIASVFVATAAVSALAPVAVGQTDYSYDQTNNEQESALGGTSLRVTP